MNRRGRWKLKDEIVGEMVTDFMVAHPGHFPDMETFVDFSLKADRIIRSMEGGKR